MCCRRVLVSASTSVGLSLSLQEAEGGEGGGEEERDKEEEGGGRTEECAALSRGRAGKGGRTLAIMRHVPACKLQGGVV